MPGLLAMNRQGSKRRPSLRENALLHFLTPCRRTQVTLRKMTTRTLLQQANQPLVQLIGVQKVREVKTRRAEVQVLTKLC